MAEMPERPSSAAFQNFGTPMPMGETTPRPVMTTRAGIKIVRCLSRLLARPVYLPEGGATVNVEACQQSSYSTLYTRSFPEPKRRTLSQKAQLESFSPPPERPEEDCLPWVP